MSRAYLGLGSNLGDRRAALEAAVEALDRSPVRVLRRSRIYETEPLGGPDDQSCFLNMVLEVETTLDPQALLAHTQQIEAALGRAREHEERWGPRPIDIDLLLYGHEVIDRPQLQVPHPRLRQRAFVLVPLCELAPDLLIPGDGSVREALSELDHVQLLAPLD